MQSPMISIIIPVYNGENYLQEAIDSALAQTYKACEVIVVDDGSTDKTKEIMDSYGDKIVSLHKNNGGVSSALNLGIHHMRGEYFAWLSHDDLLKENACEIYMDMLKNNEPETVIYANYDLINDKGKVYGFTEYEKRHSKRKLELSVYPVILGYVNGCALLVHKSHFERVGEFDETLRITQDNEMWFRIFRNSKIRFCSTIVSSKRYHPEQDSQTKNIYPEHDLFLYESLKKLTLLECIRFGGSMQMFFENFMQRVPEDKYPKAHKFCEEMIVLSQEEDWYDSLDKEQLIEIIRESAVQLHMVKDDYKRLKYAYIYKAMKQIDRFYLFGAGDYGQEFCEKMSSKIDILGFIDNDTTKQGKNLCNKMVYGLTDIEKNIDNSMGIIITVSPSLQLLIEEQLIKTPYIAKSQIFTMKTFMETYMLYYEG